MQGYFVGTDASSPRWLYYRKRTEGQNTLVLNQQNQVLAALPPSNFGTSGTVQNSSTVVSIPSDSTAFFTTDLTDTYGGTFVSYVSVASASLLSNDIFPDQSSEVSACLTHAAKSCCRMTSRVPEMLSNGVCTQTPRS